MKPSELRDKLEVRTRRLHRSTPKTERLAAMVEIHDLVADELAENGYYPQCKLTDPRLIVLGENDQYVRPPDDGERL